MQRGGALAYTAEERDDTEGKVVVGMYYAVIHNIYVSCHIAFTQYYVVMCVLCHRTETDRYY